MSYTSSEWSWILESSLPVVFTWNTHLLLTAAAPQSLYTWNCCLALITHPVLFQHFLGKSFISWGKLFEIWRGEEGMIAKFGLATAVFSAVVGGRSFLARPVPLACCCSCQLQPRSEFRAFPAPPLITCLAYCREGGRVQHEQHWRRHQEAQQVFTSSVFVSSFYQECFTALPTIIIAVRNRPWTTLMLCLQTSSRLM